MLRWWRLMLMLRRRSIRRMGRRGRRIMRRRRRLLVLMLRRRGWSVRRSRGMRMRRRRDGSWRRRCSFVPWMRVMLIRRRRSAMGRRRRRRRNSPMLIISSRRTAGITSQRRVDVPISSRSMSMRRRTRRWRRRNRVIHPRPLRFTASLVVPRAPLPTPTPIHAMSSIAVYLGWRRFVTMMIHIIIHDRHGSRKLLWVRNGGEGSSAGAGLALSDVFPNPDFDALIGKGARQWRRFCVIAMILTSI